MVESAARRSAAHWLGAAHTTGNVSGFVIFRYNPTVRKRWCRWRAATPAAYIMAFDNTGGTATGIAINSVATQEVNIPVTVRDDAGSANRDGYDYA